MKVNSRFCDNLELHFFTQSSTILGGVYHMQIINSSLDFDH
jgi:hypothetical protein